MQLESFKLLFGLFVLRISLLHLMFAAFRPDRSRTREASNDDGSGGEGFQERRNGRRRRTPLSAYTAFSQRGSSDFE